jgi:hypothetical protein
LVAAFAPPALLDVEELLATVSSSRDAVALALMGCQGLAPAEVRLVDIQDVSLSSGRLFVHGRYDRVRCLTLNPVTRSYLKNYLAVRPTTREPALLLSREGRRLSARLIRVLARQVGLNAFALRHVYARDALAAGTDPRQLRDQLGLETMEPVFESAEHGVLWEARVPRPRWKSGPLRRWALDVLEMQLEQWHETGHVQVPTTFKWPPLPPDDLDRLKAAAPNIKALIDVILDELLVARPRLHSSGRSDESYRQACLTPGFHGHALTSVANIVANSGA